MGKVTEVMRGIFLFVVLFSLSCNDLVIPPLVPPVPPNSGDESDCQPACDNLFELSCPGWKGSPGVDEKFDTEDDVPCVDVCKNVVSEPTGTLFPKCTATASSCEEVEACFE